LLASAWVSESGTPPDAIGLGVVLGQAGKGLTLRVSGGVSLILGGSGSDTVHIWGGVNIILLGEGDDVVQHHAGSLSLVLGGGGHDTRCWDGAAPPTWMAFCGW